MNHLPSMQQGSIAPKTVRAIPNAQQSITVRAHKPAFSSPMASATHILKDDLLLARITDLLSGHPKDLSFFRYQQRIENSRLMLFGGYVPEHSIDNETISSAPFLMTRFEIKDVPQIYSVLFPSPKGPQSVISRRVNNRREPPALYDQILGIIEVYQNYQSAKMDPRSSSQAILYLGGWLYTNAEKQGLKSVLACQTTLETLQEFEEHPLTASHLQVTLEKLQFRNIGRLATAYNVYEKCLSKGLKLHEEFSNLTSQMTRLEAYLALRKEFKKIMPDTHTSFMEMILVAFGHPVAFLDTVCEDYPHYASLGLNMKDTFQNLLDRKKAKVEAFIIFLDKLQEKDPERKCAKSPRHTQTLLEALEFKDLELMAYLYEQIKKPEITHKITNRRFEAATSSLLK